MNSSATLSNRVTSWRIWFFVLIVGIIFGVFLLRVFNYQILQGEDYRSLAEENRISEISLPTLRGVIYDRNGIVLARNIASYNVVVVAAILPDSEGAIQDMMVEKGLMKKKKDKADLAKLLQRIEAHLILDVICKRIAKEKPNLTIFTIHDSIITIKGNESYVSSVIRDELTKKVGLTPTLKIEYWTNTT